MVNFIIYFLEEREREWEREMINVKGTRQTINISKLISQEKTLLKTGKKLSWILLKSWPTNRLILNAWCFGLYEIHTYIW